MAVPSSRTINYDAVLSSCLDLILSRDPIDNIFKDHVLLEVLKSKGCITTQDGGERIRIPVEYAANSTADSYGGYDQLDTTPQDEFSTLWYEWKQLASSVSISGLEEAQNKGEHAIFGLLSAKANNSLMSLRELLNYQLLGKTVASGVWSSGTGAMAGSSNTDVEPIPAALSRDPSESAIIGNVNKNTHSWWRTFSANLGNGTAEYNETIFASCTTWALILQYLNKLYNNASRGGGGKPDCMIASQGAYEVFEAALRDKTRYTQQSEGSLAFDNIMFKTGCPMYWDEMMPDIYTGVVHDSGSFAKESVYVLNTKFMKLVIESDHNFVSTPFVRPENQDAKASQILFYGNLTFSNLRKFGCAYKIDGSVAA